MQVQLLITCTLRKWPVDPPPTSSADPPAPSPPIPLAALPPYPPRTQAKHVHCDVKLLNIVANPFIDDGDNMTACEAALVDLAGCTPEHEHIKECTTIYLSPELLTVWRDALLNNADPATQQQGMAAKLTTKNDVYAFGKVLLELLSTPSAAGLDDAPTEQDWVIAHTDWLESGGRLWHLCPCWEAPWVPQAFRDAIVSMTHPDPEQRGSMAEVLRMPFVTMDLGMGAWSPDEDDGQEQRPQPQQQQQEVVGPGNSASLSECGSTAATPAGADCQAPLAMSSSALSSAASSFVAGCRSGSPFGSGCDAGFEPSSGADYSSVVSQGDDEAEGGDEGSEVVAAGVGKDKSISADDVDIAAAGDGGGKAGDAFVVEGMDGVVRGSGASGGCIGGDDASVVVVVASEPSGTKRPISPVLKTEFGVDVMSLTAADVVDRGVSVPMPSSEKKKGNIVQRGLHKCCKRLKAWGGRVKQKVVALADPFSQCLSARIE